LNYITILKIIIKMDKLKKLIVYRIDRINYIGSTIESLNSRKWKHNSDCFNVKRKIYNIPLYIHIREKSLQIKLIPIAYYFVSNKSRRYAEQYWINKYDSINNGLNVMNALFKNKTLYHQEYYQVNKKKLNQMNNEYYKKNKKKMLEKSKKWRKKNPNFRKIKIICPKCNCLTNREHIKRHQRSKKCKKLTFQRH